MADAHALLGAIGAAARPAGSAAESAARQYCADWLRAAGFEVVERPFTYSALPGVWGTPAIGLVLFLTGAAVAVSLGSGAPLDSLIEIVLAILGAVGVVGWWLGRYGTRVLPLMRRSGVNLEARRGVSGTLPIIWLVAHLDTKSQPVSLLARATATVVVCLSWAGVLIAWGASYVAPVPRGVPMALAVCAALAAIPLLMSRPGVRSDGALDNATGVASILSASSLPGAATGVGVLVTSAEEFGLAGARAWVEGKAVGVALNCDGVDDRGTLTITTGARGRAVLRGSAISRVSGISGQNVRIRRALPGILLDSTAFADRGWAALTVSQGKLWSLARIHTRRDTLERLSGAGIPRAASLIAELAGAIIAESGSGDYRKGGLEGAWNHNV